MEDKEKFCPQIFIEELIGDYNNLQVMVKVQ